MTLILCKLLAAGLSTVHAVAITANIAVETAGSFDYTQRQHNGPAYGLFQMEPTGLWPNYEVYRLAHCEFDSADCQLAWLTASLDGSFEYGRYWIGGGNIDRFNATTEVAEATRVFSERILRPGKPHMDRRLEAARDIYGTGHYCPN